VGTPFGVFPEIDPGVVFNALVAAAGQGVTDSLASISAGGIATVSTPDSASRLLSAPAPHAFVDLPALLGFPASTQSPGANSITTLPTTDIANTVANAISQVFATVPPTADILTALLITLPAYDVTLFLDGITSGDPVNAIGLPAAATVGLGTTAVLIEGLVFRNLINGILPQS